MGKFKLPIYSNIIYDFRQLYWFNVIPNIENIYVNKITSVQFLL